MWSLRIRVPWGHERENAVGASAGTGADRAASTESWDWVGTSGRPARGAPPPQGRRAGRCPSEGPLWDALGLTSAAAPAAFLTVKPTTPSTLQLGWILVSKKHTEKFWLLQVDTGALNTVSQQTWAWLRTAAVWPSAPRPQQGARRQGSPRPGQAWGSRAPGLGAGDVHPGPATARFRGPGELAVLTRGTRCTCRCSRRPAWRAGRSTRSR